MSRCWRFYFVWTILGMIALGLLWRLIDLSVLHRAFLLEQSKARILRKVSTPAYRGIISDRLGIPLAVSTAVESVWVNPQLFAPSQDQKHKLLALLGMTQRQLKHKLDSKFVREFVYLKREIVPSKVAAIKALQIPGVFFQTEHRRFYPEGEITAHVVGFTNIDDKGQEGIELAYDSWLSGSAGTEEIIKDRMGNTIGRLREIKKPVQGSNIQLSLDHRIQYLAHSSLQQAVNEFHAESGSAVVLDVNTGEVLAMVNQPSYNPNNHHMAKVAAFRNRAVTDIFEPGSVIKPFTIALALSSGKYTPLTRIDTHNGWMKIGGYRIRDDLNYGVVTLTELLQKSSNIAAAKILLSLDPQQYWQLLKKIGFGVRTSSGFPGEARGFISPQTNWVPSVVATLAYGYGLSTTALQLAAGYSVLAAGGIKHPVSLLKVVAKNSRGERVLAEPVANQLVKMLKTVVQKGGTGTRAAVSGYEVAGKTGTAYVASARGYDHHKYAASFVGMAPAAKPRVVVAVVIKQPQGKHFGGVVAAPVFAKIMSGTLRLLGVAPRY